MASLVACRLALMRNHWAALNLAAEGADTKARDTPGDQRCWSCSSSAVGSDSTMATAPADVCSTRVSLSGDCGGGGVGGRVVESGVLLLAVEALAMLWVVGGWSSLVALRVRCAF